MEIAHNINDPFHRKTSDGRLFGVQFPALFASLSEFGMRRFVFPEQLRESLSGSPQADLLLLDFADRQLTLKRLGWRRRERASDRIHIAGWLYVDATG